MKKWLCIIFIGILITIMTACSSEGSEESASTEKPVNQRGENSRYFVYATTELIYSDSREKV